MRVCARVCALTATHALLPPPPSQVLKDVGLQHVVSTQLFLTCARHLEQQAAKHEAGQAASGLLSTPRPLPRELLQVGHSFKGCCK